LALNIAATSAADTIVRDAAGANACANATVPETSTASRTLA
jgi:hypothetical protein